MKVKDAAIAQLNAQICDFTKSAQGKIQDVRQQYLDTIKAIQLVYEDTADNQRDEVDERVQQIIYDKLVEHKFDQ